MKEEGSIVAEDDSPSQRRQRSKSILRRYYRRGRLRWLMIAAFVILVSLILPKDFVPEYTMETGKTWVASSLKADFDFPLYKAEEELQEERNIASLSISPVFSIDTAAASISRKLIETSATEFGLELERIKTAFDLEEDSEPLLEAFEDRYRFDARDFIAEHPDMVKWEEDFLREAENLMSAVYEVGYLDTVKSQLRKQIILVRKTSNTMVQKSLTLDDAALPGFLESEFPALDPGEIRLMRLLVIKNMVPNLYYSASQTAEERSRAVKIVSPVFGMVKKGEVIISKAERIGPRQSLRIRSYVRARAEKFGHPPFFITLGGQLVLMSIITALLILYIRNNRPKIFFSNRKLALVLLLFFTMITVVMLVLKLSLFTQEVDGLHYIYMVPMCMVVILLSAFFDARFAFYGNLIIAIFAGSIVPNGFEYFFVQICAGTAAVYSLNRLRNRADFFISLSLILLTYVGAYIGYSLYVKGSFLEIGYINLALFGLNVVLTFIAYPLIYVFEKIFGLTSDLTFIELLDTNHPLLKELSNRAPGTFQHSMQVANLTEGVLNRIGGNSLQAKVGAMFHDIGKMQHPMCFIENLGDHTSPHSNMTPEESAAVIIRHVTDGIKLAQEHNLPKEMVDYIRTHHGTTRVEFFYRKEVGNNPDVEIDESKYTYPGPLPFSREMAVLMIADSIEAASRAMKDPSAEKLRDLIEKIVDSKVRQKQFSNARLTFKDLEDAKEVILDMLVSIYHGRIEYPEEKE